MASSVERLLAAAPWLGRGNRPANTNSPARKGEDKPKPRPRGGRVVTEHQFRDAQDLNSRYGYVISVDDALVVSDHPRSPLVIGLDRGYPAPANDNRKVKLTKKAA